MTDILKIMEKQYTDSDYYSIISIIKTGANYLNLLASRNNGRSYQVKHFCVLDALINKRKFVYMRRYSIEMRVGMINSYFEDIDYDKLSKVTGIKVDSIEAQGGSIYALRYDADEQKTVRVMQIGRAVNLGSMGHYKSNTFPDYDNLIFEEYVTDQGYLFNEPIKLQHMVSTIFRDRMGKVFLIGNILIRFNPYVRDWNIPDIRRMKQGEIRTYDIDNAKIAIEHCANFAAKRNTGMFFGKSRESVVEGEFITQEYPHLPKEYDLYDEVYRINILHENMAYVMEVLRDVEKDADTFGDLCVFMYPTNKPKEKRQLRKDYGLSNMHTPFLIQVCRGDALLQKLLKEGRIFFNDNLTGTEYKTLKNLFNI